MNYQEKAKEVSCKCGIHLTASKKINCVKNMRCSCSKENLKCSNRCRCHNCGNDKPLCAPEVKRRKRTPQSLTSALKTATSYEYGLSQGETFCNTKLLTITHYILESLIYHICQQTKDNFDDLDCDIAKTMLLSEYNKTKDKIARITEVYTEVLDLEVSSFENWFSCRTTKLKNLKALQTGKQTINTD